MSSSVNSPYALRVRDLAHRPGDMREVSLDITVPSTLGAGLIAVCEGDQMHLDVKLEGLHEGVLASGTARAEATGECSRCLIDVSELVEVEFAELFAYDASEEFDYQVHDDHVDCEPVVRDAVVLSLPFQPVCRPDCPGLDPETGERLADIGERPTTSATDPRWAALSGIQFDDSTPDQTTADEERTPADQAE
ncbi:DUF177 domain-containing protein [Curtobacterium sp. MCBD17_008]|uniref:YceD family protein n=1 Tax=Curtobacterium sp. MCBD17_008 TaxID=2175656 RepID=UPI0021AC3177|nr:DUF177 domain-containing protein [Curtobacterium sp. MCBD17_008]